VAHARRKFFELHAATQSATESTALESLGELCASEREVRAFDVEQRSQWPCL
jgi:hypothetical protein